MNNVRKLSVTLFVVCGVLSAGLMVPVAGVADEVLNPTAEQLKMLEEAYSWILNPGDEDQTQKMLEVAEEIAARESGLASFTVPYNYHHTFNFTNSKTYFGDYVMTEEEVSTNLRNYVHQLLYSDIQVACQVSILDLMLFRVFDSIIIDWLEIDFCGFCNGMAQASRDYFTDPSLIPMGRDYAIELPRPSPNATLAEETGGDLSEAAIKEYVLWKGSGAFFNPNHLLLWLKTFLGLTSALGGTTNAEEVLEVIQLMNKGSPSYEPVVILMMAPWWDNPSPSSAHFVNVYDYESNANGSTTLYIYNNWYMYNESNPLDYDDWILVRSDGTFNGTHLAPDKEWSRLTAYSSTLEYNSIFTALVSLIDDLLSLNIFSPVDIEITDPLGRKVRVGENGELEVGFPAICVEHDGHKEILMPYLPSLPYTLNLTGTGSGDYRLELNRLVDGSVVTNEVFGNTTPGENDLYSMEIGEAGTNLEKQGVMLDIPRITSSSSVELRWSEYNEPDFVRYEILVSPSLEQPGEPYGQPITDADTTSAVVSGLSSEQTYFFSVRVVTAGGHADSNIVGAAMPVDYTLFYILVAGAAGAAVLLMVLVICRRRRGV